MNAPVAATMRDAFLARLHTAMGEDERIFIVSDDLGAPALDAIRRDFADRFINVGIAEQNAINVAAGLALDGYVAYAYGIAAFLVMRGYEQIRTNLSMAAQIRPLNANVVGVGAGLGYDMSGPSHHCLEDLTLMRLLPGLEVFSPSDAALAAAVAGYTLGSHRPKYVRLDSRSLPAIYSARALPRLDAGFHEMARGGDVCLVATGCMTHVALQAAARSVEPLGVVDLFAFPPLDETGLLAILRPYRDIITLEEGFIRRGGIDSLVAGVLARAGVPTRVHPLGVPGRHLFERGSRDRLHALCGMDEDSVLRTADSIRKRRT